MILVNKLTNNVMVCHDRLILTVERTNKGGEVSLLNRKEEVTTKSKSSSLPCATMCTTISYTSLILRMK